MNIYGIDALENENLKQSLKNGDIEKVKEILENEFIPEGYRIRRFT